MVNARLMQGLQHVLVSSASSKIPLLRSVQAAAGRIHQEVRVIAGDLRSDALARYVADEFWHMPATKLAYVDAILEGCVQRSVGVVIPTRDAELNFWAASAARFADTGITVVVSPLRGVERTYDKLEFSEFGKALGLPVVRSSLEPNDQGTFVVKERFGAGSRCTGVNLNVADARAHAENLFEPIFQPYVSGVEISVDAWADRSGKIKGVVLRRRDLVVDGESKITTTFRAPWLEAELTRVLEAYELSGPLTLQAIIDGSGMPHVIEINSRFGGASTAGLAVGLDSWYWSLLEAGGADPAKYQFHRATTEVRQIRVSTDLYIDDPDI